MGFHFRSDAKVLIDLMRKVAFKQRPEGGKGGSHAEAGHARCIRGTFRRPVWLERVSEEKSRR